MDIEKPILEQYEKAKKNLKLATEWLSICVNKQKELIDQLCSYREDEKRFLQEIKKYKDIIFLYETYNKIESNKKE